MLCVNLGARITEALNLNVGDVFSAVLSSRANRNIALAREDKDGSLPRFDGEIVNILYFRRETVKGQNEGVALTLPNGAKNALSQFISWKSESGESLAKRAPLFVSRQGGRLTRQQAHNAFKKAYKKAGLKGHVTTHSPRKTYAKHVYENSNNDLVVTQQALRHSDIQSTLYYLDTVSDNVTNAMPDFSFGDFDIHQKTSKSKVIEMPQPTQLQARKKRRKQQ